MTLSVEDSAKSKTVFREMGELLFTHFGLSGPLVLSGSAHMRPFERDRYKLHIDLKPALDLQKLEKRLERDFEKNINRDFQNSLSELLPRSSFRRRFAVGNFGRQKGQSDNGSGEKKLAELLKNLTVTVKKFRPVDEAIVTSGGVNVKRGRPENHGVEALQRPFFAGEVLDVDAYTGGFNLQIAFSTAHAAAEGFGS